MRAKINCKKLILAVTAVAVVSLLGPGSSSAGPSHFRNAKPGRAGFAPLFRGIGDPLPGVAKSNGDVSNFNNGLLNFQETETLKPARIRAVRRDSSGRCSTTTHARHATVIPRVGAARST